MAADDRWYFDINSLLADIKKSSVAKQIIVGSTSGWCVGYATMKVGKVAALALGGGIILLQYANHKGYINIDWSRVSGDVDRAAQRVQATKAGSTNGKGNQIAKKVESFVDKKTVSAERALQDARRNARRWYHVVTHNGEEPLRLSEFDLFCISFCGGCVLGVVTGK